MNAVLSRQLNQREHQSQRSHRTKTQQYAEERLGCRQRHILYPNLGFVGGSHEAALGQAFPLDHHHIAHHMAAMTMMTMLFWSNHFWAGKSGFSGLMVCISAFADRRRSRRSNINDVGFMPWTALTVLSVLATVLAAALAIKSF